VLRCVDLVPEGARDRIWRQGRDPRCCSSISDYAVPVYEGDPRPTALGHTNHVGGIRDRPKPKALQQGELYLHAKDRPDGVDYNDRDLIPGRSLWTHSRGNHHVAIEVHSWYRGRHNLVPQAGEARRVLNHRSEDVVRVCILTLIEMHDGIRRRRLLGRCRREDGATESEQ